MDRLPKDVFDIVVEKVSSLDDLGALCLTNRCMALTCYSIQAKTLWRITHRCCHTDCANHGEEEEGMGSPPRGGVILKGTEHG